MSVENITELMTPAGYPHLQIAKNGRLQIVHNRPVNVGDGFTINQHLKSVDRSKTIVMVVDEVEEVREAKGNFQGERPKFFSLRYTKQIIDTRLVSINYSTSYEQ